jgi:hypothetical protein
MRFESKKDLERERKAMETFVNVFKGSFKKLGEHDVDYRVFDKSEKLIAYVEVKGRLRTMANAYPLPVALQKIVKLSAKRLNPVMIWACDDGIIYGKIDELVGSVKWGGRPPREGAYNDAELMAYYDKQKKLKYIRYV